MRWRGSAASSAKSTIGGRTTPRRLAPRTHCTPASAACAEARGGQPRLVRQVHHRVKNNLQVVASLLNIHGRTAETPAARAAYEAIARRVGALSVVHRNHFAEMEENRGIALRPLMAELAAELRGGAPESARGLMIDLEVETVFTTQDVAVAKQLVSARLSPQ